MAPSIPYNAPAAGYNGAGVGAYATPSGIDYQRETAMGYSDLQRGNSTATHLVASSLQRQPTGLSTGAGIDRSYTASPYNYQAHATSQANSRY